MQIGGSKWPLTAATSVVGPRYMGVGSRQGRTRFTRWSTFFGGTHPLPTKPTNLPSHHLPNWTHISHNTWPCCKDLPGRLFNRSCVRTYIHLKVGSVRLFQIQTNCLVTVPQTNCHHLTPSLGRHCLRYPILSPLCVGWYAQKVKVFQQRLVLGRCCPQMCAPSCPKHADLQH